MVTLKFTKTMMENSERKAVIVKDSDIKGLTQGHITAGCHGTNQLIPDELRFLRDLICNGSWSLIEDFLTPFKGKESHTHNLYLVYRQEYIELLMSTGQLNREERLKQVLGKLQIVCPSQEDYKCLCLLLTNCDLSSYPEYSNWSIYDSRESLYHQLVDFINSQFYSSSTQSLPQYSKLVQLVSKGLMYEQCEKIYISRHGLDLALPPDHILDIMTWLQHLPDSMYQTPPTVLPISVTHPSTIVNLMHSLTVETTPTSAHYCHSQSVPDKLSHVHQAKCSGLNVTPPTGTVAGTVTGPLSSTPLYPVTAEPLHTTPIHEMSKTYNVQEELKSSVRPNLQLVSKHSDKQVIRSIAYSCSGNYAAVGANSHVLTIVNQTPLLSHNDKSLLVLPVVYSQANYHHGSIYTLDWYSDTLLASGSNDQSVKLLNSTDFSILADIKDLGGTVRELSFMPPSKHLVTCGNGQYPLQLIDIVKQEVVRDFKHQETSLLSIAVIDNNILVSGDEKGTIMLWDTRSPQQPKHVQTLSNSTTSLSHYQGSIACASSTGHCCIVSLSTSTVVTKWTPHKDECKSIRYSPNGQWVLTGSYDGTVCLTNTSTYQWSTVASHSNKVIQARWHPLGQFIATTSSDKTACFWKLQS